MPESLTKEEVNSHTDPSVSKQYDHNVSTEQKFEDFYSICDGLKIAMMGIFRPGVGPVARSMAVAKRSGPDFLFLSNNHSKKFKDLESGQTVSLIFQDSSKQDWVSITGEATTRSNEDPRIKEIYSKGVSAWFGDLKDGVHDGTPNDPRMTLIEVKPNYITYWKRDTGALGFMKEVGGAVLTGGVANTGSLREMDKSEIDSVRSKHSTMTS